MTPRTPRTKISAPELKTHIFKSADLVKGDFRQAEIKAKWDEVLGNVDPEQLFEIITIKVSCSGGTYMRSLADKMGKDAGTGAMALFIRRTKIGEYSLDDLN